MRLRYAVPAAIMAGLLVLLAVGLKHNPSEVPSPLIGKPAPAFDLPTLDAKVPSYGTKDLRGRPVLVNFWASWCAACQVEHPLLLALAKREGVPIVGMDYKDTPDDARAWLAQNGDPYSIVVQDAQGQAGIDWGVYGVPETYVLDANGVIRYKQIGPMTEQDWREKIAPILGTRDSGLGTRE